MKQTALHSMHPQLKEKLTDIQGWQMPLQYTDATEEYHAVRAAAGLFDVGHLGRIEIAGAGAQDLLQKIFTRNVAKLAENFAAYGLILNDAGFILDDAMVFHLPAGAAGERYLLTVNPSNTDKIIAWLKSHAGRDVATNDATQAIAQLALQGPLADAVLEKLAGQHFRKLRQKHVKEMRLADTSVLVSRTGFTGERGYELFAPADRATALWTALLESGKDAGLVPCGAASREMLRIEMGYVMYGSDIDETRTPLEAGLFRFLDLKKEFIGKDAVLKRKAEGVKDALVGFELFEKGVPKSGASIFSENREIGVVTSACHSPHRRKGVGLGYVLTRYSQPGQEIEVEVKDLEIAAKIVDLPFYRKK